MSAEIDFTKKEDMESLENSHKGETILSSLKHCNEYPDLHHTYTQTNSRVYFIPNYFSNMSKLLHVQNNIILLYSSQVKHGDFVELNLRGVGVMTEVVLFK